MNDSSQSKQEKTSTQPDQHSVNWPLWIGGGAFGGAVIALVIALSGLVGQRSDILSLLRPPADSTTQLPSDSATQLPADSTSETNPPADLREHQQLVSEVVSDLEREFLIADSPTRGNPDADIVLYKFSDFQCSYCAQATKEVETFLSQHESEVLFVYKHFPLAEVHPEAIAAALAAWAAGQQDQFWPYHDALFINQDSLGEEFYLEVATELGLDIEQFNRDRASDAAKAAIARDLALASEMHLDSTPTFIMDDVLIPGAVPADFFVDMLARLKAFKEETNTP